MLSPALWLTLIAGPAAAQSGAYTVHVEQAKLFVRKGWLDDALAELDAARATEDGAADYEVWWLTAQVRYELRDAEGAWQAADDAAAVAPDAEKKEQAYQLSKLLKRTFGALEIAAPRAGVSSRLQLESAGPVLDPDHKKWIDAVALDLRAQSLLPRVISLPQGSYLVNGVEVTVAPGERARMELPMDLLGAGGLAALQVPRVEVAAGLGMLFSGRVPNLNPSLEGQLGYTQPVGRLLLGAHLDYGYRSFQVEGQGTAWSPQAAGGGLRLGTELTVGGPLAIRPGLGYRFAQTPGVPLACSGRDLEDTWTCAVPEEGAPASDATIMAVGQAHIPYLEVAVHWRRAGRTTATGFGVRAAVDQAFGILPSEGEATVYTGGGASEETLSFHVDEPGWSATGFRLLAELSLTL